MDVHSFCIDTDEKSDFEKRERDTMTQNMRGEYFCVQKKIKREVIQ